MLIDSNYLCAYISQDEKTLVVFNLIDHIKIVSISDDGKIKDNYNSMNNISNFIEDHIEYEYDDIYGYLTCKPLNSGSTFEIRLLFENVDFNLYQKSADDVDLNSTKIITKSLEIYNKNKINLSAGDILKKFVSFFGSLKI